MPGGAACAAVIAGMLAGFVTGIFHTAFGIPAILAGILTQLALYSVNLHIMGWGTDNGSKANLPISVDKYKLLVSSALCAGRSRLDNPIFMSGHFPDRHYLRCCTGSSARSWAPPSAPPAPTGNMARAQGINTDFTKVLGLMISNGLVALSGALLSQYQGFSDINMGRGAIVIGLAAVIIGEVIFEQDLPQFWLKAAQLRHWRGHLLCGHPDRAEDGSVHR